MDNTIENFIRKQKVSFICSIDEEGFSNVKAMLGMMLLMICCLTWKMNEKGI